MPEIHGCSGLLYKMAYYLHKMYVHLLVYFKLSLDYLYHLTMYILFVAGVWQIRVFFLGVSRIKKKIFSVHGCLNLRMWNVQIRRIDCNFTSVLYIFIWIWAMVLCSFILIWRVCINFGFSKNTLNFPSFSP